MIEVLGCDPVSGKLFRKDDLKYLFERNSASSVPEEIFNALNFALCLKQRKKMDGWAAGWAVEGYLSAVKLDPSITRAIMIRFMVEKADFSVLLYEKVSFVIEAFAEKEFFPVYISDISDDDEYGWDEDRAEEAKAAFLLGFVCAGQRVAPPYIDFFKLVADAIKKYDEIEQRKAGENE